MPPGLVLVLALPCLWCLTVPLVLGYASARTARRVARRIFPVHPEGHVEDAPLLRVQRVRAWVGLVMSVAVLAVFGDFEDVEEAQVQLTLRLFLTPWGALLIAVVVVALLFWAARPGTRQDMRTNLWPAGRSALWYFGAWSLIPLFAVAAFQTMGWLAPNRFEGGSGLLLGVFLLFLFFALWTPFWWLVYFVGFSSGPALRHAFNLTALHAALPALVTAVLVWAFAFFGLATGGLPPGPVPLAVCAFLGGPLSVTALAWWEIHRLRRHGVRWRTQSPPGAAAP
ncbi:hypothetical protein ACWEV4_15140 [Streptomyces sp. NPDC003860]